jgi:hypothetical protein
VRRFLSVALAGVLFLALSGVAVAETTRADLPLMNGNYWPITSTNVKACGDSITLIYWAKGVNVQVAAAADSAGEKFTTGGVPTWLNLTVPIEANLVNLYIRFKQAATGLDQTGYTWGDIIPVYVGGLYRSFYFNVGAWDSCQVFGYGSSVGKVPVYWYTELDH